MAARKLHATSIRVQDVLGAEAVEIRPGRVTVLSGPNGSGKSTVLRAVQQALGRGSLAELARIDPTGKPTEPRVVLVLEDGQGRQLVAERNGTRPRLRERSQDGALKDVPRPQEAISRLWDSAAANPVSWLQATPDERLRLLYEALPLALDRERIAAILAGVDGLPQIPPGLPALEELAYLRAQVYERRTATNRDAAAKGQAADQIRRSAPAEVVDLADAEQLRAAAEEMARELGQAEQDSQGLHRAEVTAAEQELARATGAAAVDFSAASSAVTEGMERQISEWRAELDRRIAALRVAAGEKIDALRAVQEARNAEAREKAKAARHAADDARAEREDTLAYKRDDLAAAREAATRAAEAAKVAASAAALAAQAAAFSREAEALRERSEILSSAITGLDEYTRGLAAELPAGLEVRGRELYLDGVNFESQNTARRLEAAVAVACLRARSSDLPLILVDGAESLDPAHFNALLDALEAAGVQALVTAVSPNPDAKKLSVEVVA